jgi:hypothetical protein
LAVFGVSAWFVGLSRSEREKAAGWVKGRFSFLYYE